MTGPGACRVCGAPGPESWSSGWRDVPLWRCRACRSAFVWPVPGARELRSRYASEHGEGKWEALFDEAEPGIFRRREERLAGWTGGPGRVLDVGCGHGAFLEAAAGRGWWALGTEVDPGLARRARGRSGGRVVVGYLEALRPGAGFDAVTFWDVLEHVPEPWALLGRARDLLERGGVAVATMPNARGTTARLHGRRWKYYDLDAYGHLFHLSPRGLETLFRRAGFEVIESRTEGSTDLRYVPEVRGGRPPGPLAARLLDRLSGLLARVAVPLGLGNTLTVAGRKP